MDQGLDSHLARIEADGYTVVKGAIEATMVDALTADLARLEHEFAIAPASNDFEGTATTRVYNLLAHGGPWLDVPTHPTVLPLAQSVLGGEILVSTLSSIAIAPGESAQPIHSDDQVMPLGRPHVPTVCNSMWALTDFTEANGATRIIPGSHTRDHGPDYGTHYDSIPAEMAAGSILVWAGSLWHGGGANGSDDTRIGIAMNYCAGWVRQQENQQLGIRLDRVRRFEPRLQQLCGFGIYNGLIGHIDKRSPAERLLAAKTDKILWDQTE